MRDSTLYGGIVIVSFVSSSTGLSVSVNPTPHLSINWFLLCCHIDYTNCKGNFPFFLESLPYRTSVADSLCDTVPLHLTMRLLLCCRTDRMCISDSGLWVITNDSFEMTSLYEANNFTLNNTMRIGILATHNLSLQAISYYWPVRSCLCHFVLWHAWPPCTAMPKWIMRICVCHLRRVNDHSK